MCQSAPSASSSTLQAGFFTTPSLTNRSERPDAGFLHRDSSRRTFRIDPSIHMALDRIVNLRALRNFRKQGRRGKTEKLGCQIYGRLTVHRREVTSEHDVASKTVCRGTRSAPSHRPPWRNEPLQFMPVETDASRAAGSDSAGIRTRRGACDIERLTTWSTLAMANPNRK